MRWSQQVSKIGILVLLASIMEIGVSRPYQCTLLVFIPNNDVLLVGLSCCRLNPI
jgi:hypothetical protein